MRKKKQVTNPLFHLSSPVHLNNRNRPNSLDHLSNHNLLSSLDHRSNRRREPVRPKSTTNAPARAGRDVRLVRRGRHASSRTTIIRNACDFCLSEAFVFCNMDWSEWNGVNGVFKNMNKTKMGYLLAGHTGNITYGGRINQYQQARNCVRKSLECREV